ncbi:MAG: tripartite tricarboxylate transporter substrate binding protein [Rubritepida sp.]|nr:tripartite tricarboxylate transporter substrate binding protein [Rubritepida sp.]
MKRRALPFLAAPAMAAQALAQQAWPRRPITLIVPTPPGGATDLMGRVMAQSLGASLGVPVVVENRSGAAGVIATEQAAAAAPDGHTIAIGMISTLAVNPHIYPRLRYDPLRDFAPIGLIAQVPMVLLAQPALAAGGLAGFIARVRAAPDTVTYGSAGSGSNVHIGMVAFLDAAGLRMVHVPYRGSAPMVIDLVAGNIQTGMTGTPAALPLLRAGRVVALGTTAPQRLAQTPETPAIAETLPGFEAMQWYGLVAPARTPPEIVARLHDATNAALAEAAVRHRLMEEGAIPDPRSAQAFAAFIGSELDRWGVLARRNNLRPGD